MISISKFSVSRLLKISCIASIFMFTTPIITQTQTSTKNEQAIKESIEAIIADNYVRIPKEDFDAIVQNQLSNLVNSKFNTLFGIAVAGLTLISFISVRLFNQSKVSNEKLIKAEVSLAAKDAIKELQDYYKENIKSKLDELESRVEKSIDLLQVELRTNVDLLQKDHSNTIDVLKKDNVSSLSVINEQIARAKQQVNRAEEYMTNLEIQNLQELIVSKSGKSYRFPEDLERTKNVLKDLENSETKFQIPTAVNLLSYIYYDKRMYNEVNELISRYEKNHKLHSNTYINGALTAISDYNNYNNLTQRNKALEYLDKSLELTKGYGEALALKLEIYMMDYVRSNEDIKRQEAIKNCDKVLHDTLMSENKMPAYETVSRLVRDYKIESYKKYIQPLFIELPNKMQELFNSANSISQNPSFKDFNLLYFDIGEFTKNGGPN